MEYVCQFNETYFQFLSRWMEHYGLYYFFEQTENGEKLVVTDTAISHNTIQNAQLSYLPVSGLDDNVREDVVYNFIAEYGSVPKDVLLKDYSYQHPSLNLQAKADVLEGGVGTYYSYGDNFQNPQEASKLAQIRAQAFQTRQTQMHGESLCLGMVAGYSFSLQGHFHSEFNGDYLLTKVQHKARNRAAFTTAMGTQHQAEEKRSVYTNTFTSIPQQQQFRPEVTAEKPRFFGLLSARIDAAGSGAYAQLDTYGRYKVLLPFDLSGRKDGKASSWLRLAEPYAGSNYGLHFPLLKGTEVLVSFVDGDIDRPVILSAIHNFESMNHVKDSNQPINSIVTAGGNQFVMGDSGGKGFIGFRLPGSQGGIVLSESGDGTGSGSAGSHSSGEGKGGDDGGDSGGSGEDSGKSGGEGGEGEGDARFMSYDKEHFESSFSQKTAIVGGTSTEIGLGVKNELFVGGKSDISAGLSWGADVGTVLEYTWGDKVGFGNEEFSCHEEDSHFLEKEFTVKVGPQATLTTAMNSLRNSFKALVAASLTTAATTFGTFEAEFKNKENLNDGFGSWASITTNAVSGADLCFGASIMAYVKHLLGTIEDITKTTTVAASLELTKEHGMEVVVDNLVAPEAEVSFTVGRPGNPTENSFFQISPNGKSIKLVNQNTAGLTLTKGQKVNLLVNSSEGAVGIAMNTSSLTLSYHNDPTLALVKGLIKLSIGKSTPANILMQDGMATMTVNKQSAVTVQTAGIKLKSPSISANAEGTVKVKADGLITLG